MYVRSEGWQIEHSYRLNLNHHLQTTIISPPALFFLFFLSPGYYSRFAALRALLLDFLHLIQEDTRTSALRNQIIVLGAGFDTTVFQMSNDGQLADNISYIELDFPAVTQQKAATLQRTPELHQALYKNNKQESNRSSSTVVEINVEQGTVLSNRYSLLPVDLRDIDALEAALQQCPHFDVAAPTFILAECVLVYMDPHHSRSLLHWLGRQFCQCPAAVIALYEQVNPHDAFGRQMMLNLSLRGCPLLGIVPSLEVHAERLREAGFARAEVLSMGDVYNRCLDPGDRRRIARLEIFDEFEEWNLMQSHYCIALGMISNPVDVLARYGFSVHQEQQDDAQVARLEALLAAKNNELTSGSKIE